jgi:histone-lysine N-methyltransferase SETMAR
LSTEDEEHSGRPTQATVPETVNVIQSMILDYQRISTKKIVKTLAISRERIGYIIHEILDIRKLSAKWVPKCLSAGQKGGRVLSLQAILDQFWLDPLGVFNCVLTMAETWLHIYDPDTKEQSKEWKHSGCPHPKRFKTQKLLRKVLAPVFWDKDVILP